MTGCDGYIGSHLKPYLEENGHDVSVYAYDIHHIDTSYLRGIDMVIHLAAMTGVRDSFEKQEEYYYENVEGTKAVFRACRLTDTRVIYASSSNAKEWWTNPYAVTKKINEETSPQNSIGIRPHTVYPGRPDMLYGMLTNDVESVEYINGHHYRDFTHIEDFCSATFTIIENYDIIVSKNKSVIEERINSGEKPLYSRVVDKRVIIDIGTGMGQRVLDVAKTFGWKGEVRTDPTPKEREVTIANTDILTHYGWKPEHLICKSPF